MSRARDRAKARAAGPEIVDARKALATKRAGAWATTLRLRARYADRAASARLAVASCLQKAEDALHAVVSDGDWRYGRDAAGREIIVDWIEVANGHLKNAAAALIPEQHALALLADIDRLLAKYGNAASDVSVDGPTPQMIERLRDRMADPMQRLVDLGRLSEDDASDAREIAAIVRYATVGMGAAMMRFECASEGGDAASSQRTATEAAEWNGLLHAHVYIPWCRAIGPNASGLVISLAVEGVSIEQLRRQYGVGWTGALDTAKAALLEYRRRRRGYVRSAEAA